MTEVLCKWGLAFLKTNYLKWLYAIFKAIIPVDWKYFFNHFKNAKRDKKFYTTERRNIPFICQEMTDFFGDKIAQFMAQFCVILEALEDWSVHFFSSKPLCFHLYHTPGVFHDNIGPSPNFQYSFNSTIEYFLVSILTYLQKFALGFFCLRYKSLISEEC